jgi:hypothetical protein
MPTKTLSFMLKYRIRYREARAHAFIAAAMMWCLAAVATFTSPGDRYLTGDLKGADFVQLYTLAHVAFEGPYPEISGAERFHERQLELVPGASERYLPVYPPTAALLFRPLARLSYVSAVAVWAAIIIGGYSLIIATTWMRSRSELPDGTFVAAAAASFPSFWLTVLNGQTGLIPLLAFFLAWSALRSRMKLAAGVALSLLSIKPQFGLAIALIVLLALEWKILLGAILGLAAQLLAVTATIGSQALSAYANTIKELSAVEHLLEPDGWRMHSLRTVTRLVPGVVGELAWVLLSAIVIAAALRVWRTSSPLHARFAIAVFACVLVNPHLFAYDTIVLVLPLLLLGAWIEQVRPPLRIFFWQSVYFLFVFLLLPSAALVRVQFSVLLMLYLFWRTSRAVLAYSASGTQHGQSLAVGSQDS